MTHPANASRSSSAGDSPPRAPGVQVVRLLRRLVAPGLLLGAGFLAGAANGVWSHDSREALPPASEGLLVPTQQVTVTAAPMQVRRVQRTIEAVGTLYGFEETIISAKVEGRVQRIHHDVADRLEPNAVLAELDPTDYQLAVEQAENNLQVELAKLGLQEPPSDDFDIATIPTIRLAQARLENMQLKLNRTQQLSERKAASQNELENAVSDYRTAQAEHAHQVLLAQSGLATIKLRRSDLALAQQQLADTQIRVPTPLSDVPASDEPMTYVVTRRSVSEGSYVRPGGEIGALAIDQVLKLRVPVPERFSNQIQLNQHVDLYTAAFAEPFAGIVTLINPAVSTTTRAFDVEIQVTNEQGKLKPGGFAKAAIHISESDDAQTVPLTSLVTFAGVTKIFVAAAGKAQEIIVTPGIQTSDWVEIAEPSLPRGALVITSGQANLADDTPVAIRPTLTHANPDARPSAIPAQDG